MWDEVNDEDNDDDDLDDDVEATEYPCAEQLRDNLVLYFANDLFEILKIPMCIVTLKSDLA